MQKTPSQRIFAIFGIACMIIGLSGCTSISKPRPITRDTRTEMDPIFNGWGVENCQLTFHQNSMNMSTDGRVSDGTLHFTINTYTPLMTQPMISFNTTDRKILAEGRRNTFGFNLPYTAYEASKWVDDNAYIILTYQMTSSATLQQHFFPLTGILPGLKYLFRHCPQ